MDLVTFFERLIAVESDATKMEALIATMPTTMKVAYFDNNEDMITINEIHSGKLIYETNVAL